MSKKYTISELLPEDIKYFEQKFKTKNLQMLIKLINEHYSDPCSKCPIKNCIKHA